MKHYTFLLEGNPWYNYLEATVAQGLQALGHTVYGAFGSWQNYCVPHEGEPFDVFLQCIDNQKTQVPVDVPTVYIWGDDSGSDAVPTNYPDLDSIQAHAIFVRDYRGGGGPRVRPMNFGVEDRYFCAHNGQPKPLSERPIDVIFAGRWDNCPGRRELLKSIQQAFPDNNLLFESHVFTDRDGYWSQWVTGHCVHSASYYDALADSKIILSPMGAGPDCARHWEAMASGGIPLIQGMPTIQVPPALEAGTDCMVFNTADEAIDIIRDILADTSGKYQTVADRAYLHARSRHSTVARARYIMETLNELCILGDIKRWAPGETSI